MATRYLDQSATVGSNGKATYTLSPTGVYSWTVQQVSTELSGAPLGATSDIRKNGTLVTIMAAAGDVAAGLPYEEVRPGEQFTVNWYGCTSGQVGKVHVVFDDGSGQA